MDRSDFILKLCSSLTEEISQEDGGLRISFAKLEQFRLRNNGITFPELTFDEIRASCIGLSDVLIHRGQNVISDYDHYFFWAWMADVALNLYKGYFSDPYSEMRGLCEDAFRIALAPCMVMTEVQNTAFNLFLAVKGHSILPYLTFPLLEGILKKSCNEYVELNGVVLKDFKLPKGTQNGRDSYKKGQRCNNIRDMLFLFYQDVAEEKLKSDIDEIRKKISKIDEEGRDGFDVIGEWRNSSLHGEVQLTTIGGIMLNLICMIIIHALRDRYQEVRNYACAKIEFSRGWPRHPESFYPPI